MGVVTTIPLTAAAKPNKWLDANRGRVSFSCPNDVTMNRSDWIGIAAIVVAALFSSIQILLQWVGMRSSRVHTVPTRKLARNAKFEWFVRTWVLRIGIFIVQSVAIYVLMVQYRSSQPLSRPAAVLIACMAAVIAICFVVPLIIGVYRHIETYTVGPDA